MPPALADDGSECSDEFRGGSCEDVVAGEDSGGLEAGLHASVDAGEVGELEAFEFVREVLVVDDDEAVGFLEFGGEFGEEGVGGDADGAGEVGGDLVFDGGFDLAGEGGGLGGVAFLPDESTFEFVDGADFMDGEGCFDGGNDLVVVVDVEGGSGGYEM